MTFSKNDDFVYYKDLHVVIVIVALLLRLERLDTGSVAELTKVDDDKIPGPVAPTRTAIMKPVPGICMPVKVDFI